MLSYGQAQPRSKKQRYVNSAMKKAKLNAMAMIRQFAGEMAQSEETKEDSENMTDFVGGAFFENVFPPKGAQKNSPKWVCLAGKS